MSSMIRLTESIAAVDRGRTALRSAMGTLTYGELMERASALAGEMRRLGAGDGKPVAVCLPRSVEQVTTLLAAMLAGAAFVPIDPAWPDERMEYILKDCGAAVLVAPTALSDRIPCAAAKINLTDWAGKGGLPEALPGEGELAYIIYTSGSTGVPKGVEITHANLRHLLEWHIGAFGVTAEDHASHVAGLGFDAAVWEVWPYLATGATVSLVEDLTRVDASLLQQWIVTQGITIGFVPTPVAEPMMALEWPAETRLRTLLTGGDTLHSAPRPGLPFVVVNNYGPTECTVVATSGVVAPTVGGLPSIGRGITGTAIYLLDAAGQPVEAGEVGEMYIGGDSVGRGYRNLPEQTAASFVADPFRSMDGARMYRTGDMAKLLPNGEIAFLGRQDGQEKIRGNRIELDEIVSVLNRHAAVAFNVVIASADAGPEKHLIAYVLPVDGAAPTMVELQEFMAAALPSYMIPAKFVRLTALPLSFNGKVDRAALPLPCAENALAAAELREAESEMEVALLTLVRGLLKTDDIGVEDDFFMVGGHSLLGTQLVLRVREMFGVALTLRDLFETGTVAGLAERVEEMILEELNAMSEEEAERMADNPTA